jgi:hypothetical protein
LFKYFFLCAFASLREDSTSYNRLLRLFRKKSINSANDRRGNARQKPGITLRFLCGWI